MSARWRLVLLAAGGFIVSGLGFLFAFWRVRFAGGFAVEPKVHLHELAAALGGVRGGWLMLYGALNASTLGIRAFQLQAAARRRDGTAPGWYASYQAVAAGMMAQNVLPARLGEAVRVVALTRADDVSAANATGATVFARVLDLVALLAVTCVPPLVLHLPAASTRGLLVGAEIGTAVAVALVVAVVVFYRRRADVAERAARVRPWLGRVAGEFAEGMSALADRKRLAVSIVSALAIPITLALQYGSAMYAFGLGDLPAGTTLVLVAAILFAIAIPAAPSSVGVFHAVATFVLVGLGAPAPQAAALALVTHAVGVVSFILLGSVALVQLGGRKLLTAAPTAIG
jgi:glycosyltransferase 2 family protein